MDQPPTLSLGSSRFFRWRLGNVVGTICLWCGLATYRSYSSRPILGRWSYPYAAVLLAVAAVGVLSIRRAWRRRPSGPEPFPPAGWGVVAIEMAAALWGLAYLLDAIDLPEHADKLLDLNLFGSSMPLAAALNGVVLLVLGITGAVLAVTRSGKWTNPVLSVCALMLGLLVVETVSRAKTILAPSIQGFPTYSTTAWERRYASLNREGFRDREHPLAATTGTRRLLLVGDSYGFGMGIERPEDRVGERMARRLSEATGEVWEGINASRPNSNTLDEIRFLQQMLPYHPDLVILLYVFNDADYLHSSGGEAVAGNPSTLVGRLSLLRLLFNNSYAFQEFYVRARRIFFRVKGSGPGSVYNDDGLLQTHLADVARFVAIAEEAGATVAIVPFDNSLPGAPPLQKHYHRFVEAASSRGLPVVSLEHAFDAYSAEQLRVNGLDSHPNELADSVAVEQAWSEVARRITEHQRRMAVAPN